MSSKIILKPRIFLTKTRRKWIIFGIKMSLIKRHIKNQIKLMDDGNRKNWIESLYTKEKFQFIYDRITGNNHNPGNNIKEFWPD